MTKDYKEQIEKFVKNEYPRLYIDISVQDGVVYIKDGENVGKGGSTCTGIISGDVADVLKLRAILINGGNGRTIYREL